jgi:hypothetical protein
MTAAQKVLALPELLERIIVELPEWDIISTAARVSETWCEVITTSSRIRDTLFDAKFGFHVDKAAFKADEYAPWQLRINTNAPYGCPTLLILASVAQRSYLCYSLISTASPK